MAACTSNWLRVVVNVGTVLSATRHEVEVVLDVSDVQDPPSLDLVPDLTCVWDKSKYLKVSFWLGFRLTFIAQFIILFMHHVSCSSLSRNTDAASDEYTNKVVYCHWKWGMYQSWRGISLVSRSAFSLLTKT